MALDVDQLRAGLVEYRGTLANQRDQLQGDFAEIQQMFAALWAEYGGNMAEELQQHWGNTAQWFEEYLRDLKRLDSFLEQRIERLQHL